MSEAQSNLDGRLDRMERKMAILMSHIQKKEYREAAANKMSGCNHYNFQREYSNNGADHYRCSGCNHQFKVTLEPVYEFPPELFQIT